MGLGAVCHTLNPRLFLADLEYIINHAEDKILMLDLDLAGLIAKLRPKLPTVQQFIVLTDRQHMHKVVSIPRSHHIYSVATPGTAGPLHGEGPCILPWTCAECLWGSRMQAAACMPVGPQHTLRMSIS